MTRTSPMIGRIVPIVLGTLLVGVTFGGCSRGAPDREPQQYIVTATPIDVRVGSGLCVAVDPRNPKGVWWWEPGKDCSTRSTGPTVFQAEEASVVPSEPPGTLDIRFRLQVKRPPGAQDPPFVDVALRLEGGHLRAQVTGDQVATVGRHNLEIPEAWGRR